MGYSKGGDSKSQNINTSVYPTDFLAGFENRYGRGIGLEELAGMLPQGQSIFGNGGSVGGPGGQQLNMPGTGGGAPGGGQVGFDVVNSLLQGQYVGQPQRSAAAMQQIRRAAGEGATGITMEQLLGITGPSFGPGGGGPEENYLRNQLPAQLQQFLQPQPQRFQAAPGGVDLSALQIPQSIQRMFGPNAVQQAGQYGFRDPGTINAAQAAAQQMNIAPEGFQRYEDALYGSLFNPTQRSLNQQGSIDDRKLQAELAQSGLSTSGAGVGQVEQQRLQRREQLGAASQQAALQATAQRYGQEFAQQQFNAQQRQQTALANAGFDQDAQKTNAANILAGDTLRSEAYLKTIGLNNQSAQAMRQDFLQLMGITQKELERLDASALEKTGVLLNNWLQQGALLGNLGQRGTQKTSSSGGSGGGLTITGQGSTT